MTDETIQNPKSKIQNEEEEWDEWKLREDLLEDEHRSPYDPCRAPIPANVVLGPQAFIETTYAFRRYFSRRKPGLILGKQAGIYTGCELHLGENALLELGDLAMLTSAYIRCEAQITIGNRVMISWNVGIFDTRLPQSSAERAALLESALHDPLARLPVRETRPVVIEDDAWIGFGSVILPGVRIGAKSVIGARSVVSSDIPAGVIAAGNPARIIREIGK